MQRGEYYQSLPLEDWATKLSTCTCHRVARAPSITRPGLLIGSDAARAVMISCSTSTGTARGARVSAWLRSGRPESEVAPTPPAPRPERYILSGVPLGSNVVLAVAPHGNDRVREGPWHEHIAPRRW